MKKGLKILILLVLAVVSLSFIFILPNNSPSIKNSTISKNNFSNEGSFQYDIFEEPEGDTLVIFEVKVPGWTPEEDVIHLSIDTGVFVPTTHSMKKINNNTWIVGIKFPKNTKIKYRYDRNGYGFMASEQFIPDADTFRTLKLEEEPLTVKDEVEGWRWLREKKPEAELYQFVPADLPEREEGFIIGISIWDFTDPNLLQYAPSTFERIKNKGFEYVQIPYFTAREKDLDPIIIESGPESNSDTLSLTEEATKKGLKVIWWIAIESDSGVDFPDVRDDEWHYEYSRKRRTFMIDAAKKAEEYKIPIIIISNTWPSDYSSETQRQLASSLARETIREMRKYYSGKISTDFYWEPGIDYFDELDWLGDKWPFSLTDKKETNLEEMKQEAEKIIDERFEKMYEKYKKPIFLQVGYSSYDGAAGALQIDTEGPEVSEIFPYNDDYPFDFQEQVDAYEAFFQAIYDEPIFVGADAFGYGYWNMHDKSFSIRDKPAEDVWVKWNNIFNG